MAACQAWKYRNVTPAAFRALQTLGKQKGISIPGSPSGSFSIKVAGLQVSFQYEWDGRSGSLVLSCVSKPPLLGCSTIKSFADKIVAEAGGKPA
ncbi:hypothetical protein [Paenibacillus flagellatus]|uniref:Uncharacterized protein n=1 Tax=Paenibacillus flagellatus TaxID=2211139 RepID=A0A2V5KAH9_9BACL|nr:hypothetical protein [Paenibacillus flagellatus]PYI56589.1 hypothetical protein DLM86_06370 [Paenibacillus flagellatus]